MHSESTPHQHEAFHEVRKEDASRDLAGRCYNCTRGLFFGIGTIQHRDFDSKPHRPAVTTSMINFAILDFDSRFFAGESKRFILRLQLSTIEARHRR